MTCISHTRLPLGLNTLATRDAAGVTLLVSSTLPPDVRRAAARTAIRAARRAGWMTTWEQSALLIPLIFPVKAATAWLTAHLTAGKLALAGIAAATITVGTVVAVTLPHTIRVIPPVTAPGSQAAPVQHARSRRQPQLPPQPGGNWVPTQAVTQVAVQVPPSPSPGTSSPAPSPSVSVSVSASPPALDADICMGIPLPIDVCDALLGGG